MKRAIVVAVALAFVLAACGKEKHSNVTLGDTSASPGATASASTTAKPGASASAKPAATSKAATSAAPGDKPTASTPKPAAAGGVNAPKDGSYVYRTDGTATDPQTGQPSKISNQTATAKQSHSGNVYTTEATSSNRGGKTSTRTRWEATKVSLLSINIDTGQFGTFTCDYNPKPVILHIPIKVETFPTQQLSGNGNACGGTLQITVLRKEDASDASGKSWSTWVVHVKINSQFTYNGQQVTTNTDDMRWFSPDLGVEIKSHTKTTTNSGLGKQTSDVTSVLKSHP